ncbi:hypothetical protein [Streptomyces flaveolus]|uniref:hypothetical protein n=1 Tax=Streptomyces flaveolus TaxID=67297 RepID=UPI0033D020C6
MGYNAIYPAETIEAHRAFINRRRTLRSAEEYRTPTDTEWEDFLGHFERRKLSVGNCARAYGTACIYERPAYTLLPAAFRPGLERPAGGKSGADGVGDDQKTSSRARRISSPDMRERSPARSPWNSSGAGGFRRRSS